MKSRQPKRKKKLGKWNPLESKVLHIEMHFRKLKIVLKDHKEIKPLQSYINNVRLILNLQNTPKNSDGLMLDGKFKI